MTPEILSKLNPRTQHYEPAEFEAAWQDILLAMQGCDPGHQGFMLYVYGNDPKGRHSFFASLFTEVMARPEIQAWISKRRKSSQYRKDIERMVLMAIVEWRHPEISFTNSIRAKFLKISQRTWERRHRLVYETIVQTPARWRDEVMELVSKRLN